MEMVSSVPVAQQAMVIMIIRFFSRSSVCFSVHLRMHLRTPKFTKISWGRMPQDPLEWTAAGRPCSVLQQMTLPPSQMEKLGTALHSSEGGHVCCSITNVKEIDLLWNAFFMCIHKHPLWSNTAVTITYSSLTSFLISLQPLLTPPCRF